MGEKNIVDVLEPQYMKEFSCIGTSCEDTCCIGWRIDIDTNTYNKYLNDMDKLMGKNGLFEDRIIDGNEKTEMPPHIKMLEGTICPFLNDEKLCDIQLRLGEDYLSKLCHSYPRTSALVDGQLEMSASISCPEIARLALKNEDGIAFSVNHRDQNQIVINSELKTNSDVDEEMTRKYFWDLRLFSLGLLQNREISVAERLILLGVYYQRFQKCKGDSHNLMTEIENAYQELESDKIVGLIEKIDNQGVAKYLLVRQFLEFAIKDQPTNDRYRKCIESALKGLGYSKATDSEDFIELYKENKKEYYDSFMDVKGHIIENFLVNEFFRVRLPHGRFTDLWDSYLYLCSMFVLTKTFMIGISNYENGLSEDRVVDLLQSFSKYTLHSKERMSSIMAYLNEKKQSELKYLIMMIEC